MRRNDHSDLPVLGQVSLDRRERTANLPFRVGGKTYELPVTFYFFDAAGRAAADSDTVGDKKNFVAHGHTLMFTSNGQAHHHWTPLEFRDRTKLNKIAKHVLVIVADPLPIAVRTDFFTADRSGVRASEETLRLESSVAEFLAGWDELREINSDLVLESINSSRSGRPTLEVSRQIRRAIAARDHGFSLRGTSPGGPFGAEQLKKMPPKPPAVLHADPTVLRGPECMTAVSGSSKTVRYVLDARDEFIVSGRGRLTVRCTHPEIGDEDIAVGPLHNGRIRVIVTVPAEAELGEFRLIAGVYGWERASGGLGRDLECQTDFQVVAEPVKRPPAQQNGKKNAKSSDGPQDRVALARLGGVRVHSDRPRKGRGGRRSAARERIGVRGARRARRRASAHDLLEPRLRAAEALHGRATEGARFRISRTGSLCGRPWRGDARVAPRARVTGEQGREGGRGPLGDRQAPGGAGSASILP